MAMFVVPPTYDEKVISLQKCPIKRVVDTTLIYSLVYQFL